MTEPNSKSSTPAQTRAASLEELQAHCDDASQKSWCVYGSTTGSRSMRVQAGHGRRCRPSRMGPPPSRRTSRQPWSHRKEGGPARLGGKGRVGGYTLISSRQLLRTGSMQTTLERQTPCTPRIATACTNRTTWTGYFKAVHTVHTRFPFPLIRHTPAVRCAGRQPTQQQ
jgi:hypothetical protein